ncbi:MAG: PD40 domain-containing protein [Bacteroidetes bacterium]|nr:PD40 domain-containing protein [Bacteroidota bacterium]
MKIIFQRLVFIFFLFFYSFIYTQTNSSLISEKLLSDKSDRETFEKAETVIHDENYLDALPLYQNLLKKYPDDGYLNYRLGICYLYRSDIPEKSLEYLKIANDKKIPVSDLSFYYGRALHLNYLFSDAIKQFQNCISSKPSSKLIANSKLYIEYCKNAKEQVALPLDIAIKNIGKDINTQWAEYVPVISSDEVFLIFTYRGLRSMGGLQSIYTDSKVLPDSLKQYYEDIFYSYKIGSRWIVPDPIGGNINTNYHDAAVALSADGQKLFIFKSTPKDNGDIYMSILDGNMWSNPVSLGKNINTNSWEGSCSLSADEKIIYFSSERTGGFGGKDIWKSQLQPDGSWGKAENLGSIINTQYDEDAPFIHPDGKMLHYSSNGLKSMGGYDVFRTYLQNDGSWSKPQNLGYPVNTVDDDIYYVVSADGSKGYYSSARAGGFGMQDIYEVKPGVVGKKNALVSLKGNITLDDSPVKATIRVVNADAEKEQGIYFSNSVTGKYLINLPTGCNYKIFYSADGTNEEQIKAVNTTNVDYYMEATIDVPFYTSDVLAKRMKNKLSIINKDGSVFKTSIQSRNGMFLFNYLPPEDDVMYKLTGEDVEFINKIMISVSGIQKTLLRGKDKFFRYDYLYPESSLLIPISESDPLLKKKNPELMEYAEIIDAFGKYTADGLSFTVQVSAYYEEHNFNYFHLVSLGKTEPHNYNDGITRFTIGLFASLAEAEEMRKKVVALGGETTDSFVLAVYQNKRILLKDLAEKNFYNKK